MYKNILRFIYMNACYGILDFTSFQLLEEFNTRYMHAYVWLAKRIWIHLMRFEAKLKTIRILYGIIYHEFSILLLMIKNKFHPFEWNANLGSENKFITSEFDFHIEFIKS